MDGFYEDLDGSLCGKPNCTVIQKRDIYDPAHCSDDIDDEFQQDIPMKFLRNYMGTLNPTNMNNNKNYLIF